MVDGSLIQEQNIKNIPSVRRNPILAEIFHRLGFIERRGSGLKIIFAETAQQYNYRKQCAPVFHSTASAFHVVLRNLNYSNTEQESAAATLLQDRDNHSLNYGHATLLDDKLVDKINDKALLYLSPSERAFYEALKPLLQDGGWITNRIARELTSTKSGSAQRFLRLLCAKQILEAQGEHNGRRYRLKTKAP